jgi:hypothetical protein
LFSTNKTNHKSCFIKITVIDTIGIFIVIIMIMKVWLVVTNTKLYYSIFIRHH